MTDQKIVSSHLKPTSEFVFEDDWKIFEARLGHSRMVSNDSPLAKIRRMCELSRSTDDSNARVIIFEATTSK
jgi:hypothetical protein